ncbi:hypothetical protein COLO4_19040 [Corchorus olitorius]|uniref:Uncharacterized protein n=1 Tax=Corchorus olitorius TaxID=93759 RepID=A0A1R3J6Y4_9ROSI|nr:hypothetical protein COLO4_19040 [Corchorus olitorius]
MDEKREERGSDARTVGEWFVFMIKTKVGNIIFNIWSDGDDEIERKSSLSLEEGRRASHFGHPKPKSKS